MQLSAPPVQTHDLHELPLQNSAIVIFDAFAAMCNTGLRKFDEAEKHPSPSTF